MSDENKNQIAQIALQLFSAKGYESVGVQEICNASQITKPTLYHYFKSKRGLLEFITETYGNQLLSEIQNALIYEHDFINSLTKVLKTEIDFAFNHKEYFMFHCVLMNSPDGSEQKEVYSPLIAKISQTYFEFFCNSAAEFGNMKGKENLYSTLFHNNTVSTAMMCLQGKFSADDQTIYQIIHSTVYGFAD